MIKIFSYIDGINERLGKVIAPLTLLMSFVVFLELFIRNVLGHPTIWSFEVTIFLFAICSLMSGGVIEKNNSHICVDIIISRLSEKNRLIIKIICFPVFLFFVGCMVYFGWSFFAESLLSKETSGSAWDPYIFPIKIFLPLGATLLLLQGIANLIREIQIVFFNKKVKSASKEDLGSF